jgi:zinc protease
VVINGYLNTGAIFDSDEKLGLANFTAAMLMRGTDQKNFNQIFEILESSGASLGFGGNIHTTSFSGKALIEDLPMLLGLLFEFIHSPTFPEAYVEKMRAQLLTGLAMRAQDTAEMASITFDQLIFAGHPYSRLEDGYPETVAKITRDDIAQYHKKNFGPKGMVISVVGAIEANKAVDLVKSIFSNWSNPRQPDQPELGPYSGLSKSVKKKIIIPGKIQSDVVVGWTAPLRKSPDYMPISLGNSILGQFGMYGRIGDVIREQSGLAYYAYTRLNSGIGPGSWEVSAGVNPVNVEKTITLIKKEIKRFVTEPVLIEELKDSQANYIGRLPLSMESNAGVASALVSLERYQLGLDYYREYASLVKVVTPEQILEATQKYLLPNKTATAIAGP